MKAKTESKPTEALTVSALIRLTIKGVDVELTHDEGKALCIALSSIVGSPAKDEQLSKMADSIERIKNRPERIPTPLPMPYPVPVYPRSNPWPWREVWCSTDKMMSLSTATQEVH